VAEQIDNITGVFNRGYGAPAMAQRNFWSLREGHEKQLSMALTGVR